MKPKVILITGASSGIGKSAARLLLKKGHTVYAAARRTDRMEDLRALGAHIVSLDVTNEESSTEAVGLVLSEQGRIDVLVNNAGFGQYGAVENVSTEDARRQFDVNVFGLARLCRLVLPGMRERKAGRIINVASMAGHFCEPHGGWYHASKYAVVGLTGCLRQEVRNFGIEVIKIEPGEIRSEWSGIAMQNLCNSSKGTAYEKGALRQSRLYAFGEKHLATDPMAVAKAIAAAATCRRPRLTYRTGFGCIGLSVASAILPQRWFDAIFIRLFT